MKIGLFLKNQRDRYALELKADTKYWYLSAATLSYFKKIQDISRHYMTGRILDAGAGFKNIKSILTDNCYGYTSLDIDGNKPDIDIIGDVQDMKNICSETFDTVYSSQVLEHIQRPCLALAEFHRVLKSGGHVVISAPHISGLHEEPFDFYRYTPHGLRFLLENSGFNVKEIQISGGLFSFLSHPLSFVLVSIFWPFPVVRWAAWALNVSLIVFPMSFLDKVFSLEKKFPNNVIIVGKKP